MDSLNQAPLQRLPVALAVNERDLRMVEDAAVCCGVSIEEIFVLGAVHKAREILRDASMLEFRRGNGATGARGGVR